MRKEGGKKRRSNGFCVVDVSLHFSDFRQKVDPGGLQNPTLSVFTEGGRGKKGGKERRNSRPRYCPSHSPPWLPSGWKVGVGVFPERPEPDRERGGRREEDGKGRKRVRFEDEPVLLPPSSVLHLCDPHFLELLWLQRRKGGGKGRKGLLSYSRDKEERKGGGGEREREERRFHVNQAATNSLFSSMSALNSLHPEIFNIVLFGRPSPLRVQCPWQRGQKKRRKRKERGRTPPSRLALETAPKPPHAVNESRGWGGKRKKMGGGNHDCQQGILVRSAFSDPATSYFALH